MMVKFGKSELKKWVSQYSKSNLELQGTEKSISLQDMQLLWVKKLLTDWK